MTSRDSQSLSGANPRPIVGPCARHTSHHYATMSGGAGYHNRQPILAANISNLLSSLSPSTYDEIAPKIEYWIEYVIAEQFMTTDDLVERVSSLAWEDRAAYSDILRLLKDFRDTPRRSEAVRSFVVQLCTHVLRWFAISAAEDFSTHWGTASVASGGGEGFVRAAMFVGYLIECGLLSHDLVRRHLIKPLVTHRGYGVYRARAIYQLFLIAGNTLLQGPLEPGDVQVCFGILDILRGEYELNTARLNVCCDSRPNPSHYDQTCVPGTSRDPCCVVAAQGGRANEVPRNRRRGWGGRRSPCRD